MSGEKKYGLQIPNKKKISAFQEEDEELENDNNISGGGYIDYIKQTAIANTKVEKQYKEALSDDPTAFEYDSVFDSMKKDKEKKQQIKQANNNTKESKYISSLMEQSNLKKKQYERVKENQILKEREAEGDQFKDKEVYVTQAYKRKLENDKIEKERLEKEEKEELSKKKDISSFHRNLYSSIHDDKPRPPPVKYENNKNNYNNRQPSRSSSSSNNYHEPQYEKKKEIQKDEYERYNVRRNSERQIEAARQRYLERKQFADK